MALPSDLVMQFVKATKGRNEAKKETTVYGTIVESDGSQYVRLDGSELLTPISRTSDVHHDDRVTVLIKNHTAVVTGNLTSPSARVGDLKVTNANVDNLRANKLDANTATLTYATIGSLQATDGEINKLKTERLTAIEAIIGSLNSTYANIDFTNIGKAAMEYFYAKSGLIEDVVVGDQTITGQLIGVTINGDRIIGNTIVAEKLVVKGSDGLYYKLNTDGIKVEAEQTDENSLNGQIIKAKSITATKIAVDDLVAFGATIGGFHITDSSLYSGVKESVDNTTRGIYLDDDGQFSVGDSTNYFKYYKDTDGQYKLAISVSSLSIGSGADIETAIGNLQNSVNSIEIGGRNLLVGTKSGRIVDSPGGANENYYIGTVSEYYSSNKPTVDSWVTLSFDWSAEATSGTFYPQWGAAPWSIGAPVITVSPDNQGGRYIYSWRYRTSDLESSSNGMCIRLDNIPGVITFKNAKLELGNKPTDWTPAPEDIDGDISNAQSAADTAQATVDGLEVGGRNYIRYGKGDAKRGFFTEFPTVENGYGEVTLTSAGTYSSIGLTSGFELDCRDYTVGKEMTFSYDIMYTKYDFPEGADRREFWMGQRYTNSPTETEGQWQSVTQHSMPAVGTDCELNKWTHVVRTIKIPKQAAPSIGTNANIQLYNSNKNVTAIVTFRIKNVKLEYGNKATDWTPAASDIDADISNASKTATNFISYDASNGLQVGNKSSGTWQGFRSQITNAAFRILNSSGTVLASYGEKLVELGRNATDAIIKLCGGKGQIEYTTDPDDGESYLQVSADKLRLKSSQKSSLYSMYTNNSSRWEKSAVNVTPKTVSMYASECIDPTLVEKVEGWSTSEFDMNGTDISGTADRVAFTARKGMTLETAAGEIKINGMRFGVNKMLWSGGAYMNGTQTVPLSEAISKQTNGIVLVFSYFDGGVPKDHSFSSHFISKYEIAAKPDCPHTFLMAINAGLSTFGAKYLYIGDNAITGHASNMSTGTSECGIKFSNDKYVLRYVIGV